MVLLIGNYPRDRQQSMQRFASMMSEGLASAGVTTELIQPEAFFGNFSGVGAFMTKWLGYIDKYLLFPRRLKRKLAGAAPSLVHICDHSNAVYVDRIKGIPTLVTSHDLLAVRGAIGDETDCPASFTGKFLQRWILSGLRRATAIACVSRATCADAEQLVRQEGDHPRLHVITLGLNYPYRKLADDERVARLAKILGLSAQLPFVIHVGSNLRRKNREGVLRIFARCKSDWNGRLVIAGDALSPSLRSLAEELGISDRIVEVLEPSSEELETLYNSATALLYPSRFEGFGWPIAEAQACGCPVICSDRGPLPEVAGDAALIHPVENESEFAADLLRLTNPAERAQWSQKSLHNAQRFDPKRMIAQYIKLYREITGPEL